MQGDPNAPLGNQGLQLSITVTTDPVMPPPPRSTRSWISTSVPSSYFTALLLGSLMITPSHAEGKVTASSRERPCRQAQGRRKRKHRSSPGPTDRDLDRLHRRSAAMHLHGLGEARRQAGPHHPPACPRLRIITYARGKHTTSRARRNGHTTTPLAPTPMGGRTLSAAAPHPA